jgi:catechol 2,3-dioxygenase-like lactoylglutathione lyase family enzyme
MTGRPEDIVKRTWTIIGVRDVPRSFKWYQSLFGQRATAPEHREFGQLVDSDGTVLLCLHEWAVEDHPSLMSPDDGTPGNGLLLFFRVDDCESALRRARALVPRLEEEPHVNPNTRTKEFSLRDPDGYYVTISALSAAELRGAARQRPKKRLQPTKARGGSKRRGGDSRRRG